MSAARSQFRGTDGPWTMVHAGGDEWQIHGKEDGEYIDGRAVDRTPIVVEFVGNKADARLIAAAPELLEAISKLLECCVEPWNEASFIDARHHASVVIAKALKP